MAKSDKPVKAFPVDGVDHGNGHVIDHNNKFIPIETIIEYAKKDLSFNEIAKLCGCSAQNIHQRLKSVGFNMAGLEHFKSHRGDVFAFMQSKLLNSIDDTEIKKLNPYQRIIGMGILYDKERLERGQSTEIIDITHTISSIEELSSREKILEAEYRLLRQRELNTSEEIKTDKNR